MEKQDILNQIEWHLEETEGENASGTFDQGYKEGCYHCEALIEQLDEPQKVKVPEFVAEWFEENKHNLNFAIYELCEAGKVPVDLYEGLTYFERWFYLNHDIDTLIRMQDGYEIEEKPKFIVKQKDGFYIDGLAMIEGKTYAKTFESEAEAYKWAELCSGMIEKV